MFHALGRFIFQRRCWQCMICNSISGHCAGLPNAHSIMLWHVWNPEKILVQKHVFLSKDPDFTIWHFLGLTLTRPPSKVNQDHVVRSNDHHFPCLRTKWPRKHEPHDILVTFIFRWSLWSDIDLAFTNYDIRTRAVLFLDICQHLG